MQILIVFIGGGLGCILRYLIGLGIRNTPITLPLGTLVSNVSACIIFAITLWLVKPGMENNNNLRLLMLTGFCGGLSTFSTFGYETFLLLRQEMLLYAILNILVSVLLCIIVFYIFS